MDLDDVAEELYGLPQARFVEVRTQRAAQAKADGDRELSRQIGQLRKPTAAAWAVNLLVRRRAEDVSSLLDLGDQLREAQASLAGDDLRELTKQRRQLVAVLARAARSEAHAAGQAISEAAEQEVAQTLLAALADPRAGDAVRSGRLTASLAYSGVGPVDEDALQGALATVSSLADRRRARDESGGAGKRSRAGTLPAAAGGDKAAQKAAEQDAAAQEAERRAALQRQRREEARVRLVAAQSEQERADAAAGQAEAVWRAVEAGAHDAARDVERLEAALEVAREAVSTARRAVTTAERERRAAQRHAEVARQAAERAQAELDRLEEPGGRRAGPDSQ